MLGHLTLKLRGSSLAPYTVSLMFWYVSLKIRDLSPNSRLAEISSVVSSFFLYRRQLSLAKKKWT